MEFKPCTVHIVVDSSFGDSLASLPADEPIWVVDSFRNRPAIHRLRKERTAAAHAANITQFDPQGATSKEILLQELAMIDLHHGECAAETPWNLAVVYGTKLTPEIEQEFAAIGFAAFELTAQGFIARRQSSASAK